MGAFKLDGDVVTIDLKAFDEAVSVHGIPNVLPDVFRAIGEEVAIRRLVACGVTFEAATTMVGQMQTVDTALEVRDETLPISREYLISSSDGGKSWIARLALPHGPGEDRQPDPEVSPLAVIIFGDKPDEPWKNAYGEDCRGSPTRGTIVIEGRLTAPAPLFMTDGSWDGKSFGVREELRGTKRTAFVLRAGLWQAAYYE